MKIIQVLDYNYFGEGYLEIAKSAERYVDIIWFRIKDRQDIYEKAKRLRDKLPNAFLVLSLNAEIASELGYQGVQLGVDSDIDSIRHEYPNLKIGYSAHSIDEIRDKNADYFTLSPIFHTEKDFLVKPLGLIDVSGINKVIYGLGGISSENFNKLHGLGFSGVAGISFYKELAKLRSLCIS